VYITVVDLLGNKSIRPGLFEGVLFGLSEGVPFVSLPVDHAIVRHTVPQRRPFILNSVTETVVYHSQIVVMM